MQSMSKELWGFANDANDRVQELEELLRSADIVMQSGANQQVDLEENVEFLKGKIKKMESNLQLVADMRVMPTDEQARLIRDELQESLPKIFTSELEELKSQVKVEDQSLLQKKQD